MAPLHGLVWVVALRFASSIVHRLDFVYSSSGTYLPRKANSHSHSSALNQPSDGTIESSSPLSNVSYTFVARSRGCFNFWVKTSAADWDLYTPASQNFERWTFKPAPSFSWHQAPLPTCLQWPGVVNYHLRARSTNSKLSHVFFGPSHLKPSDLVPTTCPSHVSSSFAEHVSPCDDKVAGEMCQLRCLKDFHPVSGTDSLTCSPNAKWSGRPLVCGPKLDIDGSTVSWTLPAPKYNTLRLAVQAQAGSDGGSGGGWSAPSYTPVTASPATVPSGSGGGATAVFRVVLQELDPSGRVVATSAPVFTGDVTTKFGPVQSTRRSYSSLTTVALPRTPLAVTILGNCLSKLEHRPSSASSFSTVSLTNSGGGKYTSGRFTPSSAATTLRVSGCCGYSCRKFDVPSLVVPRSDLPACTAPTLSVHAVSCAAQQCSVSCKPGFKPASASGRCVGSDWMGDPLPLCIPTLTGTSPATPGQLYRSAVLTFRHPAPPSDQPHFWHDKALRVYVDTPVTATLSRRSLLYHAVIDPSAAGVPVTVTASLDSPPAALDFGPRAITARLCAFDLFTGTDHQLLSTLTFQPAPGFATPVPVPALRPNLLYPYWVYSSADSGLTDSGRSIYRASSSSYGSKPSLTYEFSLPSSSPALRVVALGLVTSSSYRKWKTGEKPARRRRRALLANAPPPSTAPPSVALELSRFPTPSNPVADERGAASAVALAPPPIAHPSPYPAHPHSNRSRELWGCCRFRPRTVTLYVQFPDDRTRWRWTQGDQDYSDRTSSVKLEATGSNLHLAQLGLAPQNSDASAAAGGMTAVDLSSLCPAVTAIPRNARSATECRVGYTAAFPQQPLQCRRSGSKLIAGGYAPLRCLPILSLSRPLSDGDVTLTWGSASNSDAAAARTSGFRLYGENAERSQRWLVSGQSVLPPTRTTFTVAASSVGVGDVFTLAVVDANGLDAEMSNQVFSIVHDTGIRVSAARAMPLGSALFPAGATVAFPAAAAAHFSRTLQMTFAVPSAASYKLWLQSDQQLSIAVRFSPSNSWQTHSGTDWLSSDASSLAAGSVAAFVRMDTVGSALRTIMLAPASLTDPSSVPALPLPKCYSSASPAAYTQPSSCDALSAVSPPCLPACLPGFHRPLALAAATPYTCNAFGRYIAAADATPPHCVPFINTTASKSFVYVFWSAPSSPWQFRLWRWSSAGRQLLFSGGERNSSNPVVVAGLSPAFTLRMEMEIGPVLTLPLLQSTRSHMTPPGPPPSPTEGAGSTGGAVHLLLSPPVDTGGEDNFARDGSYVIYLTPLPSPSSSSRRRRRRLAAAAGSDAAALPPTTRVLPPVQGAAVTLYNLTAQTAYAVRVLARNAVNECAKFVEAATGSDGALPRADISRFSPVAVFTTGAATSPQPPDALTAADVVKTTGGALHLSLRWPRDYGGAPVHTLLLRVTLVATGEVRTLHFAAAAWRTVVLLPRLRMAQQVQLEYAVESAVTGHPQRSAFSSPPLLARTKASVTPPGACALALPSHCLASAAARRQCVTGGSILVLLTVPDRGGVEVVEATVRFRLHNASASTLSEQQPWSPGFTGPVGDGGSLVGGLSADTEYDLQAYASNFQGSGPLSSLLTLRSGPAGAPGALVGVRASDLTASTATLSWQVVDTGGLPLEGFTVVDTAGNVLATAAAQSRRVTVPGLSASTLYSMRVRAERGTLFGPYTSVQFRLSSPVAPSPVRELKVRSVTGSGITVEWLPPTDRGGLQLEPYTVEFRPASPAGTLWTFSALASGSATSATVKGLTINTNYNIRITAENAVGASPAQTVDGNTPELPTPPGTPQPPTTEVVSKTEVRLTWVPPDTGGSPITGYTVCAAVAADMASPAPTPDSKYADCASLSCASTSQCSHTVSFTLATYPWYRVKAENVKGLGPLSDPVAFYPPLADGQPYPPVLGCVSHATLSVSWQQPGPLDNAPLTGYVMLRDGTEVTSGVTVDVATRTASLQGLAPATAYLISVRAVYTGLSTKASDPLTVTTSDSAQLPSQCSGSSGAILSGYPVAATQSWLLSPTNLRYSNHLALTFASFDVECDYDTVTVSTATKQLFSGGCSRVPFLLSAPPGEAVTVQFTTDSSMHFRGFRLEYVLLSTAPAPSLPSCSCVRGLCNGHGCSCESRWSGESCSGDRICPGHSLCDAASSVILVSPFGDDTAPGTLGVAQQAGKAVQTLQQALSIAYGRSSPTTVLLAPGTHALSSELLVEAPPASAPPITVATVRGGDTDWASPVAINGLAMPETVLNCTGSGGSGGTRALRITGGSVAWKGIHFKGCDAGSGNGGAVLATAGAPSFHNCKFTQSSAATGGAVAVTATASVSLHNCIVTGSTARANGGAIAVLGAASLSLSGNSSLWGNSAAAHGGALWLADGASFSGEASSSIRDNTASLCGGNVAMQGASSLAAAVVSAGTAPRGGGLCVMVAATQTAVVSGGIIRGNAAVSSATQGGSGGGVHVSGGGLLRFSTGALVTENSALAPSGLASDGGVGGGVAVAAGTSVECIGCTVSHNTAAFGAGLATVGVNAAPAATTSAVMPSLAVTTLTGLHLLSNTAMVGAGGAFFSAVSASLTDCVVEENTAHASGGGFVLLQPASAFLRGRTAVQRNEAPLGGGVLMNGTTSITGSPASAVSENLALYSSTGRGSGSGHSGGGNIAAVGSAASIATVTSLRVTQGKAGAGTLSNAALNGGGMLLQTGRTLLVGVIVSANGAAGHGGGLLVAGGTVSMDALSVIANNTAAGSGGGVAVTGGATLTTPHPTVLARVTGNQAGAAGGGVWVADGVRVQRLHISHCSAPLGGGLQLSQAGVQKPLRQLTLTHNSASVDGGGLMVHAAPPLSLTDLSITDNTVTGDGGRGGGAFLSQSTITHTRCTFSRNSAPRGGNVALHSASFLGGGGSNPSVTSPPATATAPAAPSSHCSANAAAAGGTVGGNLYFSGATASASHLSLTGGRAATGGGAAVGDGCAATLSDTSLTHNLAVGNGGALSATAGASLLLRRVSASDNSAGNTGGALFLLLASLRFHTVHFSSNHARLGGAIAATSASISIAPSAPPASLLRVVSNRASSGGGGVVVSGSNLALSSLHVSANTAARGAGVLVQPTASGSVHSCTITRNTAASASASVSRSGDGGGVYAESSSGGGSSCTPTSSQGSAAPTVVVPAAAVTSTAAGLTLSHCTVTLNTAALGAGVYVGRDAALSLTGGTLASNTAAISGGGAYATARGRISLQSLSLSSNSAVKFGGGVAVADGAVVSARNVSILRNTARLGGGLSLKGGEAEAESSQLSHNTAQSKGGGVYAESDSLLTFSDVRVTGNSASHSAGGLSLSRDTTATLRRCIIATNSAAGGGGGIAVTDSLLTLLHSTVSANSAGLRGGGIATEGLAEVNLTHCTLAANTAESGGALLATDSARVTLQRCTLDSNSVSRDGAGVHVDLQAQLVLLRATFTANSARDGRGGALFCAMTLPTSLSVTTAHFSGNSARDGGGIYWRYHGDPARVLRCSHCSFHANRDTDIATNPDGVRIGWFPTAPVLSGVGIVGVHPVTAAAVVPNVVITDFYGQVNRLSAGERCRIRRSASGEGQAADVTLLSTTAKAVAGRVSFSQFRVKGDANVTVALEITCEKFAQRAPMRARLTIGPCLPGQQLNTVRECDYCPPGSYSPHGAHCWPCPNRESVVDSTCSRVHLQLNPDQSHTQVHRGSRLPASAPGRFLAPASRTRLDSIRERWPLCFDRPASIAAAQATLAAAEDATEHAATWEALVTHTSPVCADAPSLHRAPFCALSATKRRKWEADMEASAGSALLHTCLTGAELYTCPMGARACPGGSTNVSAWQCNKGYRGPLCAVCAARFYLTSSGLCKPCAVDGVSERASRAYYGFKVTIAVLFLVAGILLYVRPRKQRVRVYQGDPPVWRLLWLMMGRGGGSRRVRPEKVKIMLSFAQVFNTMRNVYPRVWPRQLADFMRAFASANLDMLRISGIECLADLSFYNNLLFLLIAPAAVCAFLSLLLQLGRDYYNRQLLQSAPVCAACGHPTPTKGLVSPAHLRELCHLPPLATNTAHALLERLSPFRALHTFSAVAEHDGCTDTGLFPEAHAATMVDNLHRWRARAIVRMEARNYNNKVIKLLFWLLLLAYPAVSVTTLMLFYCKQVGDSWYLARDFSLQCYDPRWTGFSALATLGIFVYILGVPLLFFGLLTAARNHGVRHQWESIRAHAPSLRRWVQFAIQDAMLDGHGRMQPRNRDEERAIVTEFLRIRNMRFHQTRTRLGFIYHSYRDRRWWYEIVELLRKLLMNGVIIFVHPTNAPAQLTAGLGFATFALTLCLLLRPYERKGDQVVAVLALSQLTLTLFLGVIKLENIHFFSVDSGVEGDAVSWIVILSNLLTLTVAFFALAAEIYRGYIKTKLEEAACRKSGGRLQGTMRMVRVQPSAAATINSKPSKRRQPTVTVAASAATSASATAGSASPSPVLATASASPSPALAPAAAAAAASAAASPSPATAASASPVPMAALAKSATSPPATTAKDAPSARADVAASHSTKMVKAGSVSSVQPSHRRHRRRPQRSATSERSGHKKAVARGASARPKHHRHISHQRTHV